MLCVVQFSWSIGRFSTTQMMMFQNWNPGTAYTACRELSSQNISDLPSLAVQSLHPSNCLFLFNQCWLGTLMNLPNFCSLKPNVLLLLKLGVFHFSCSKCFNLQEMLQDLWKHQTVSSSYFHVKKLENHCLITLFLPLFFPLHPYRLHSLSSLEMPHLFLISFLTFMSILIYM
jgi:hypothetical protein